ncbi:MAG TPA: ABC transporter ATP-binding protein [Polyangia bacterium]|jgi:ABC-type sugar transport system ATPase subunit
MAELRIEHVGKDHGATRVLGDVSLSVADGELLVLVGPSGCGKSTLLRCIAGLEELSRGAILMDGADITRAEPRDRDIAMVFQSYALYPHLTVRDNLAFGLKMRKTPKDEIGRRIGEAAEMLGLTPLLDRRPAQLSGGQRQRVAMGRAVVRRPKVFLFDEPLSNLDAALRGQMRVELMRLHQRLSATMVYVTHDQVEAMTLADRIAVLSGGVLMQVGAPSQLYGRPANLFVAKFIGTPEMNVLDARAAQASRLTGALPATVTSVGVRAEDLRIVPSGVAATVDVVEHLGAEALVHLRVEMIELIARVEAHAVPRSGERVHVAIDPTRLHCFGGDGARVELDHRQPTADNRQLSIKP